MKHTEFRLSRGANQYPFSIEGPSQTVAYILNQKTVYETEELAALIVRAVNSHERLVEALELTEKLIKTARKYFPKSIYNADRFQLENTCAAIGKAKAALEAAKGVKCEYCGDLKNCYHTYL